MRSHNDDLLQPAQRGRGHLDAGSPLAHVAQLMRSLRYTKLLLNRHPVALTSDLTGPRRGRSLDDRGHRVERTQRVRHAARSLSQGGQLIYMI